MLFYFQSSDLCPVVVSLFFFGALVPCFYLVFVFVWTSLCDTDGVRSVCVCGRTVFFSCWSFLARGKDRRCGITDYVLLVAPIHSQVHASGFHSALGSALPFARRF